MTAINKQITFRLAPFPPFWAWYPAKFAAPKMKVSRRQHCIIVYAVKPLFRLGPVASDNDVTKQKQKAGKTFGVLIYKDTTALPNLPGGRAITICIDMA